MFKDNNKTITKDIIKELIIEIIINTLSKFKSLIFNLNLLVK